MEQAPVGLGEALEQTADLEVVASHGADLRRQLFAHILGDGFLSDFTGEVIAALGGVFVERTLEEVEGVADLTLELFLAELEGVSAKREVAVAE